jgi:hypothetical protein
LWTLNSADFDDVPGLMLYQPAKGRPPEVKNWPVMVLFNHSPGAGRD